MVMTSINSRAELDCKPDYKLNWDVTCSDESGDEEQLTSLVRSSYLKHLKHCLSKNYERSVKSNISIDELNFCTEMLERKALRSCMVTSIYQRKMAHIINKVKEATQNETLYLAFQKKLSLFELNSNRCNKETQTIDENTENLETKKENLYEEEIINNNNSNSSNSKSLFLETFGTTEAEINKKLEDENGVDTYEELLNILLSSPKNPVNEEVNCEVTNKVENNPQLCKKRKLQNGNSETNTENQNTNNSVNIKLKEKTNSNCKTIKNRIDKTNSPFNYKSKSSLLVNWSYELFIQNTHLENILSKLSPLNRAIVEKRFKDLFGNDLVTEENTKKVFKISEEELSNCRKRIAGIIVGELTPFYVEGKIGSRPVFKNLAKKLTDDIMCTTLTPEPESIRNTIQAIFMGGKHINSLKDAF